jgi:hypothetical protein
MPTQTLEQTRERGQRWGSSAGYEELTAADPQAMKQEGRAVILSV